MAHSIKTIREKSQSVIKKHGESNYPVNLKKIAESLDITIDERSFDDDISGLLAVNNGDVTIAINKKHSIKRQRFTIAHELGHYFLHVDSEKELFVDQSYNRDNVSSAGSNRVEIEANRFAAELLMPIDPLKIAIKEQRKQDDLFNDDDADKKIGESMIGRLSEEFDVSPQAMEIRLSNMMFE